MSSDSWNTPRWLCRLLPKVDLDPCSNLGSWVRAGRKLAKEDGHDGLAESWAPASTVFINPPYSRGNVSRWVGKATAHVLGSPGRHVFLLVKLDPTTRWWAQASQTPGVACDTYLFRRRIKFEGAGSGAKFCSALLVLRRPDEPVRLPPELAAELW